MNRWSSARSPRRNPSKGRRRRRERTRRPREGPNDGGVVRGRLKKTVATKQRLLLTDRLFQGSSAPQACQNAQKLFRMDVVAPVQGHSLHECSNRVLHPLGVARAPASAARPRPEGNRRAPAASGRAKRLIGDHVAFRPGRNAVRKTSRPSPSPFRCRPLRRDGNSPCFSIRRRRLSSPPPHELRGPFRKLSAPFPQMRAPVRSRANDESASAETSARSKSASPTAK